MDSFTAIFVSKKKENEADTSVPVSYDDGNGGSGTYCVIT
ncbi:pheromone-like peptide [Fomitiporia mediterranea MF3/22]|nr:pheromone-like peptide [Fomitiporia mediterranea MF3/22]EJD05155.1 pheromone-like peptide [Fomitiporia mediterranea MF3/22]